MKDPYRNLVFLLWCVIAVLIIGAGAGGYVLVRHASDLDQTNASLVGDNDSLKRQVQQARAALAATPTPTVAPLATPQSNPTP